MSSLERPCLGTRPELSEEWQRERSDCDFSDTFPLIDCVVKLLGGGECGQEPGLRRSRLVPVPRRSERGTYVTTDIQVVCEPSNRDRVGGRAMAVDRIYPAHRVYYFFQVTQCLSISSVRHSLNTRGTYKLRARLECPVVTSGFGVKVPDGCKDRANIDCISAWHAGITVDIRNNDRLLRVPEILSTEGQYSIQRLKQ